MNQQLGGLYEFIAILNPVDSDELTIFSINAESPEIALNIVKEKLPKSWVGGIEICDSETLKPNEMPLLDYWKD